MATYRVLFEVRYGTGVHESDVGDPNSVFDAQGPPAEQVVRIDTARVVHDQAKALVVTVAGEIDLLTVKRLCFAVSAGFDQLGDDEILIVDLTGVTFLGSPGLQALVDVTNAARRRREPLRIVVDQNRPVIRPIQITGLNSVLALFDTVEHAMQPTSLDRGLPRWERQGQQAGGKGPFDGRAGAGLLQSALSTILPWRCHLHVILTRPCLRQRRNRGRPSLPATEQPRAGYAGRCSWRCLQTRSRRQWCGSGCESGWRRGPGRRINWTTSCWLSARRSAILSSTRIFTSRPGWSRSVAGSRRHQTASTG